MANGAGPLAGARALAVELPARPERHTPRERRRRRSATRPASAVDAAQLVEAQAAVPIHGGTLHLTGFGGGR